MKIIALLLGLVALGLTFAKRWFRHGRNLDDDSKTKLFTQAEQIRALEDKVENFSLALSAITASVFILDRSDRLFYWNDAAAKLFDWPTSLKKGDSIHDVLRTPLILQLLEDTQRTQATQVREIAFFKNDRELWVMAQALLCRLKNENGVAVVLHDQSSARELDRKRQDFIANASHELRTPLTVIKGYLEILLDPVNQTTEQQHRYLQQIGKNVDYLSELTRDMLALARSENRSQAIEMSNFNVIELIDHVVARYAAYAEKKAVKLKNLSNLASFELHTNEQALDQIVSNLIDNAIKYSKPNGLVTLSILPEAHHLHISIQDKGMGIPPEDLDRIFERFFRVNRARTEDDGGTGLGLAIAKHLTESMGGTIEVQSGLEKGSTFTVRLPVS